MSLTQTVDLVTKRRDLLHLILAKRPRSDETSFLFFKDFIYLFMRDTQKERERERGRDTGRGKSRLHAGSPMWDLIPGPQDQALGRRRR